MKYIELNNQKYLVMKEYRDALDEETLKELFTDYFLSFDYIVGDWSYNHLRLKGFNSKTNPNFKEYNDVDKIEEYLNTYCAYGCKYFILSKEHE